MIPMRLLVLVGAGLLAHVGTAQAQAAEASPQPKLRQTLAVGRPAKPVRIEIVSAAGVVELHAGTARLELPLSRVSATEFRSVKLAGGAAVAVVELSDGSRRHAALVGRDARKRPNFLWSGRLDLHGDAGERGRDVLEVSDRTGDGAPDLIVGRFHERAHICGQQYTLLDPRAVDPSSLRLRPVLLDRLQPTDGSVDTIQSLAERPQAVGDQPLLGGMLRAQAVSSQPGPPDPTVVTPPTMLTDQDATTHWVEGRGSGGRGEFVTFRWDAPTWPIRAIALRGPAASPDTRIRLPQRVTLVGNTGQLKVELNASTAPGQRHWIVPPKPLPWSCLSIVLGKHDGPASHFSALAEVEVYTALDFGEGLDKLVEEVVGDTPRARAAVDGLSAVGAKAVPALRAAWPRMTSVGRRRTLQVFGRLAPRDADARAGLRAAVADPDGEVSEAALSALLTTGEPALDQLAELAVLPGAQGDRVARTLGRNLPAQSFGILLSAFTVTGGSERPALREALRASLRRGGDNAASVRQLLAWLDRTPDVSARAAVALALCQVDSARPAVAGLVAQSIGEAQTFPDQWRLIRAAAELPAGEPVDGWLAGLAREGDPWMLRAEALKALSNRGASAHGRVATAALRDPYPRVRMAALAGLKPEARDFDAIAERAQNDRWAMVRAAALGSLSTTPASTTALRQALGDRSPLVRAAAVRGLIALGEAAAWPLIEKRLQDKNEWPEVQSQAVRFVGQLCIQAGGPTLLEVLRRGLLPNAWEPDVVVAMEAFEALLRLGGNHSKSALQIAKRPLVPESLRRAAEQAVKQPPKHCATAGQQSL